MDTHSVTYTTVSNRNISKNYLDLVACNSRIHFPAASLAYRMEGHQERRRQCPSSAPHVGIIGAGVAGLRCADVLLQHGFQVTILEGRDRVGGRMHQVCLPNTSHLIDIGPNWIHGTINNPILDLAEETGTEMHSWGEKIKLYEENGRPMGDEESAEYSELMWKIVGEAFKHSNEEGPLISVSQSFNDFFLRRMEEHLPVAEKDNEKKRKILLQLSKMWGILTGGTIEKQSLKFFWLEETIGGDNLFCAGTYKKILEKIAQSALQKGSIKFLTEAKSIDSSERHSGKVAVTTNKEEKFDFDEVVVTAPLGWLKRNKDSFLPPLPIRLSAAIDSIGYGCLEKVFISFPQAFWLPTYQQNSNLSPNSPEKALKGDCTGFNLFLYPQYSARNPEHWIVECLELGSLPQACTQPTLLFYISDPQSHAIVQQLSQTPSETERHQLLTETFHPYFSRLNGFSDSNPDCVPVSTYATQWLTDHLAGNGSYSNFPVPLENGDADIENMREGLPDRGLWLAGEHTAPFVVSGTVTGAYWSGEAVGKRIALAYGMGLGAEDGAGAGASGDLKS